MLILLLTMVTAQADELYEKYNWETWPTIEICPESNVSVKEVQIAMDYWEAEVNFDYAGIKKVSTCSSKKENTIQITDGKKVSGNELANTAVHTYAWNDQLGKLYIDYALISIPVDQIYPDYQQELITHEMGHAIGYGHSNHEIMKASK